LDFRASQSFNSQNGLSDPDPGISVEEYLETSGVNPPPSGPGTLQLTEATYEVDQIAGSVTIGVARTDGATGPVSIDYATSAGTATPGVDYVETSGVLNFIDGQLSDVITVPVLDDTQANANTTFTITLSDPTGGAVLGAQSSAVVTIDDDKLIQPTTFMVTNTNDSGPGSLRQAILDSNSQPGIVVDTIAFDITGGTIILPQSPLPPITNSVIIDATTQPGYAGTPLVQITGLLAGNDATGLDIEAGGTTVKGLIIDGFNIGIEADGGDNTIENDWIGPDMTGTLELGNLTAGIDIPTDSSGNVIGYAALGDVVSDNDGPGIVVAGDDNSLWGNFIGTDETGLIALGNSVGIVVNGSDNQIGGSGAGEGNLISGNNGDGIDILGLSATGNTIQGNVIGLDSSGNDTIGNGGEGILISARASGNLIGGTATGAGNVVNNGSGVAIDLENGATSNSIEGNTITGGGYPYGEEETPAVLVTGASNNTIGGIAPGAGNQITSTQDGVDIYSATGVAVRGNAINVEYGIGIGLDANTGANNLENSPSVTSATLVGTGPPNWTVVVDGTLDSTPLTAFAIDLYTSFDADQTGEVYLTTVDVVTDATGQATWTVNVAPQALSGYWLTATATDPGNNTSEFSSSFTLDCDNDGIPDWEKAQAPDNYGAYPDRFEANIAPLGDQAVFIAPPGTQFQDVGSANNPSPSNVPGAATFPEGLFSWQLAGFTPGAAVTVQMLIPDPVNFNDYYIYGPTPDDPTPHWENFTYDGTTGAVVSGQTITLYLVDGQRGDNDLTANGVIEELGGPVFGPETFWVTNTNDSGPGSLRQAILDSNARVPVINTIAFDIGCGPQTIDVLHQLPAITNPVIIDGTTQPGYAGAPIIVLNWADDQDYTDVSSINDILPPFAGLDITAGSTTVRGLVLDGFNILPVTYAGTTQTGLVGPGTPIVLDGSGGNVIEGNYIGTDITGTVGEGGFDGINIEGSSNNLIGGTSPEDRNVISGLEVGVLINNFSNDNAIEGNLIGTAADGVSALGNGFGGVVIANYVQDNTIGGTAAGAGNVIAFNGGAGVSTVEFGGISNPILGNSIYNNVGLGIDSTESSEGGVLGDGYYATGSPVFYFDGQYVELPNYPILSNATIDGDNTVIEGRIHNSPNATYRIEFFSNIAVDPSSFGEGQTYLGAISVTTDSSGDANFTATVPTVAPGQQFITATATNAVGTTSQFSARIAIGEVLGSVYVVNSTADTDDGTANPADLTLREAIIAANEHPGLNTIEFDIGSGVQTITPLFDLPAIINPVIIDATTQPGYQGTPLIVLSGTLTISGDTVDPGLAPDGLRLLAGGSTIRGLVINDFQTAILSTGPGGNTIQGNFIGTDATGTKSTVTREGIVLSGSGSTIGGTTPDARNVISGIFGPGIDLSDSSNNLIEGNLIGTDVSGTRRLPNSVGISIDGDDNTIGGTASGARNIISGNSGNGVQISGTGNLVEGDFIGTDITGTQSLGNGGSGVVLLADSNELVVTANSVGGTTPGAGNLISGNSGPGIDFDGVSGGQVEGNLIGTDVTGTQPLGNGSGIVMQILDYVPEGVGLPTITIGGTAAGAGNLISGNSGDGLLIQSGSDMLVAGNRIGTAADGIDALGNSSDGIGVVYNGFSVYTPPSEITVGGTAAGAGNTIAFNGGRGVNVVSGSQITILANSIFANGALGIDLGGNGVTLNHVGSEAGPNGYQNFPVITQAIAGTNVTQVAATLNSLSDGAYTLSFYASTVADPSGYGQGEFYLGSTVVQTDASGNATVTVDLPVGTLAGEVLTATATDAEGDTSEFSLAVTLTQGTTTIMASPTISTQASETGNGVVGTAVLSDTASIGGGDNPTGAVAFTLTLPNGTTVPEGSVTITGDGTYAAPDTVMATQVGTYTWLATYAGDSLNNGAVDNGADESLTTVRASPTISTQASESGGGVVGTAVLSDAATITGSYQGSGTITFSLTAPDGSTTTVGSPVTVSGDGSYAPSTTVLATEVGTYTWQASYSGDSLNNGAMDDGTNELLTTVKASPTIATQVSETGGGVVGTAVLSDSVTVSGGDSPTGVVSFSLTLPNGTSVPEGSITISGDGTYAAPDTVTATQVGTYTWLATYAGDSLNNGAVDNGTNESLTTIPASPSITTLASETGNGVVGTAVLSDTVSVSGGYNPTGAVSFTLTLPNGTTVSEGSVSINGDETYTAPNTVLATQVGTYTWHASYSGDSLNNGAVDDGTNELLTTVKASPTIATQVSETGGGVVGTAILSDTVSVSGGYGPTGLVSFSLTLPNGTTVPEGSVSINGDGTYSAPDMVLATQVGTYTWHASYAGDSLNNGAVDNGTNESLTTVKASPQISTTPGGPVTLGKIVISGTNYLDPTGNGFSTGDTPQAGVTIDLYLSTNGSPGLQTGCGGDLLVASTTTASNGTYTFAVNTPGTYYVQEVVPTGYVQTGGGPGGAAGDTDYTVVASAGTSDSGYNFCDYQVPTGTPTCVSYKVTTPGGRSTTVSLLDGNTAPGDTVTVTFTVPSGMNDTLTLVSYEAPSSTFSDSNAYEQSIYQHAWGTFAPGMHTLTAAIPSCDYQIDFVCGQAINELEPNQNNDAYGPDAAEILYHAECRFIDSDIGGNSVPSLPTPPTPMTPAPTSSPFILSDSATLSGGDNPTGTITFYLFAPNVTPNSNDSNAVYTSAVTVNGDGTYTTAAGKTTGRAVPTMAGTYEWVAVYSGDAYNSGVTSVYGSDPEAVLKASPKMTTTPGGAVTGGGLVKLSDSALLSGGSRPTGTITFYLFAPGVTPSSTESNNVYADTVTVNGDGTYTTSMGNHPGGYAATTTGTYEWQAVYSGDSNNNGASDTFGTKPETVGAPCSVGSGQYASWGFWQGQDGQATICSFGNGPSDTCLGNWLASSFPNLFGCSNPYISGYLTQCGASSLAGLTNQQIATLCTKLSTFGTNQDTYAQAFACALGIYADTGAFGGDSTCSGYGFNVTWGGYSGATFDVDSNNAPFGVSRNASLSVWSILQNVNNNFSPSSGSFYGGNSGYTTSACSVLYSINTACNP